MSVPDRIPRPIDPDELHALHYDPERDGPGLLARPSTAPQAAEVQELYGLLKSVADLLSALEARVVKLEGGVPV